MGPRLASLTLDGFKSFATRVELAFPSPITAIIGPNGAGKSNICDAIAWVLGEQSARLLRSQTMSDVIFAGAPSRDPAGTAQVGLALTSTDGRWAETENRLAITRRVMRDGTSEYRLAGRRARLKDVLDRLMDAGIGTRAYAIIEQGRIGQVLSVRATERRALFEEAAGITKYRVRRHEAELKLAETRANLLRVADVAGEVRRALDAARRQARRAERHTQLRAALVEVRAELFSFRRAAALQAAEERRGALAVAEEAEAAAAATLAVAEAAYEALRRDLDAAQASLAKARAGASAADTATARKEAEEAAARRESEEAAARSGQAHAESVRLAGLTEERAAHESELIARLEVAQRAAEEQAGAADEAGAAAEAADARSRAAIAAAEEARRALLTATAVASEARNRAHRLGIETEQNDYQRSRLEAEHARLSEHFSQAAQREREAAAQESAVGERAGAAEQARQGLRARHEELSASCRTLADERDRAAHQRWQARHEREGVARLLESARALPQAVARAVPDEKLLGTVADYLDPDPETAGLLDRAYGDLLAVPVLADDEACRALLPDGGGGEGRIEVVVAGGGETARPSPLLERAGVSPEHLAWMSRALPRATIAASEEEAHELAASDPDLIVLLPGRGKRFGRRVELPGTGRRRVGVMELRHREREAKRREAVAAGEEERLEAELLRTRGEQERTAGELAEADAAVQRAAEALAAAGSSHQAAHRELARLQRELDAVAAELERLAAEREGLSARVEEARSEAERLATRAGAVEAEVDTLVRAADRARDEATAAIAEAERRRGLAAVAAERAQAAERELERYRLALDELRERQSAAERLRDEQSQLSDEAARRAEADRQELADLLGRGGALHREAEVLAAREQELKGRADEAESSVGRARTRSLAARDDAHAARLTLAEAEGAIDRLGEQISLTLPPGFELPEELPDPATVPELEQREGQLLKDLEALGPVNELAVTERDELEERHRFLTTQRRDLERSLESLADTVRELDATSVERFLATLEETNQVFPEVFRRLFGGGNAFVELSDPDNPLASGVEIRVRPPGKHTQSVLLLSGGEKALAAVALLLSLFRIRPAPFCVLDEVDAPLDDANVERFCHLIREMSEDTQFLLITHNRRTMAHADVLYGVTMEEPGVSRVVSVRMET